MEDQEKYGAVAHTVMLNGDRIAIKPFNVIPESKPSDAGLLLPNTVKSKETDFAKYSRNPCAGLVYFVGNGIVGDHETPMPFKKGETVVFEKMARDITLDNGRMIITPDGEEYYIVRRSEIMFSYAGSNNFEEAEKFYNTIKAKIYE